MDPITALATATAIFNGIKKSVEVGREVQDIFGQLSQWASAVEHLKSGIQSEKKPSIFKKLEFGSETSEAFDAYAAEVKLQEMEKEIFHWFIYGHLQELGIDGYRRFKQIRQDITNRRVKLVREQAEARADFVNRLKLWGILAPVVSGFIGFIWWLIIFIQEKQ
jgi:DNA-binding FrmR family transcriptional regulator